MNLCEDCSSFDLSKTRHLYNLDIPHRPNSPVRDDPDGQTRHEFGARSVCISDVGMKYKSWPDNGCDLCEILYSYYQAHGWRKWAADEDVPDQLRAFSLLRPAAGKGWSREVEVGVFILCLMQEDAKPGHWDVARGMLRSDTSLLCYHPKKSSWMFRPPGSVRSTFDAYAVQKWIQNCKTHPNCKPSTRKPSVPTRLIDCHFDTVITPARTPPYVALSYVWGGVGAPPAVQFGSTATRFDRKTLPKTISDAIDVIRALGYRFLWVDQLCIDQINLDLKLEQISNMDVIYMAAELTLVAVSGSDANSGLPGSPHSPRENQPPPPLTTIRGYNICRLMRCPREDVAASIWYSRAWTYQEAVLSRRLLYFTEQRVVFTCAEASYCEDIEHVRLAARVPADIRYACPAFMPSYGARRHDIIAAKSQDFITRADNDFQELTTGITEYSQRHLTFDSDALLAFSAVMNTYQARGPEAPYSYVAYVQGLPIFENPHVSRDTFLAMVLEWASHWDKDNKRRPGFPTWSWVGWKGQSRFSFPEHESLYRGSTLRLLFEDVYVEDEDAAALKDGSKTWRAPIFQPGGVPNPSILGFFARRLPVDSFTTEEKHLRQRAQRHPNAAKGWKLYGCDIEVVLSQHRRSRAIFLRNLRRGVYQFVAMSQLDPPRDLEDAENDPTTVRDSQQGLCIWILRKNGDFKSGGFYVRVGVMHIYKYDNGESFRIAWRKIQEALSQSPLTEWRIK